MLISITRRRDGTTLYETDAADLKDALQRAVTTGAALTGAVLTDADLRDADLRGFRDDLWAVLSTAPHEAQAVLDALRAGKVNGYVYEGDCACLVGTIANAKGCHYTAIPGLVPDARRLAEVWFMQIKPQTPENHPPAKIAAEWIEDWLARMRETFGSLPSTVTTEIAR